ncbi:hypothetical protein FRC17_010107 [Serendipita sp. 399]|nr:hypothetical protein FRC17_010107 [Serendipita sp. 399]
MSAHPLRLDGGPTPKQAERVEEFIKSREKDLKGVSEAINEENIRDKVSLSAISNLDKALPELRRASQVYEDLLSHVRAAGLGIAKLRNLVFFEVDMDDEADSSRLYDDFVDSISCYISQSNEIFQSQQELLQSNTRQLQDRIHTMEAEVKGWRSSHELVTASLEHLISTRKTLQEQIRSARQILHPIRRVPSEIWIEVFRCVVSIQLDVYLQSNSNIPMQSPPYTLSHVCRSWRQIVMEEKSLWGIVVAHPCKIWSSNKVSMTKDTVRRAGARISFITNLSQSLSWFSSKKVAAQGQGQTASASIGEVVNNFGQAVPHISPQYSSSNPYKLYIDMEDDQERTIQKASQFPFDSPTFVVLSCRGPLRHGNLLMALSSFRSTRSLTILNDRPIVLPPARFSDTLPQLTYLRLEFKKFPSRFPLDGYLPATLEELHIRDDDGTSLPSPTNSLQLPKLHTLGINYPARSLLEEVEMNTLSTLVFYNCGFAGATAAPEGQFLRACNQLTHLKFDTWGERYAVVNSRDGAMGAFGHLAKKLQYLGSLTFDRCYVDGGAFMELIKSSKEKDASKSLPKLEQIVLSHTEGITRDHCDELKKTLSQIKVFR